MDASDVKRMKELEVKNTRLKQMFAELSLEDMVLKDVMEKDSEAGSTTGVDGIRTSKHAMGIPPGLFCVWREPERRHRRTQRLATATR